MFEMPFNIGDVVPGSRDKVNDEMKRLGATNVQYLDDGVYVGYDGHQLWLVSDRGSFGGIQRIALDTYGYMSLNDYVNRLRPPPTGHHSPKVG